ncbi:uncharacterized protein LOC126841313 isoform X1 [Adelges cooleyi]|uniref:uncharacterized protein LOC126841313 isoform X1 n=1 Tax=Adelges cooleyi TaxID=133065 RepID=UPI0021806755|nr:uncharacterized protein LOC126841313 isoform X1 [Adelges cooleyi]
MYFKLTFFLIASVLIANVVGPETGERSDTDITDVTFSTEKLENEFMRRTFVSILSKNGVACGDHSTITREMFRDFLNDSEMSEYVLNYCRVSSSRNNVIDKITLEEFMHLIRSATERSTFNTINEFTKPYLKLNVASVVQVEEPETRDHIKSKVKGDKDFISVLNKGLDIKPENRLVSTEDLENELMYTIFVALLHTTGLNYEAHSTINLDMFRGYVNDTDKSNTILDKFHLTGECIDIINGRITLEQFKHLMKSGSQYYIETLNEFTKQLNQNI